MAALLVDQGLRSKVDDDGDLEVTFTVDGVAVPGWLIFDRLDDGTIWNLRFTANLPADHERRDQYREYANGWKRDEVTVKLFVNDEEDLVAEQNFPVQFGLNPKEFVENGYQVFIDGIGRVLGDIGPGAPGADDEVEDPGESVVGGDFVRHALDGDGGEGSVARRLPENRIAADGGDRRVPGPDGHGEVERRHHAHDPQWMPLLVHPVPRPLGVHGEAVELAREPDAEVADVDHLLDFALSLGADLSHLEGDQVPEGLLELAQGVTKGNEDAAVTIIEFGDFQCPACQQFATQHKPQVELAYVESGKAKFVYYDWPITTAHPNAFLAARASRCAADQNRYWEYHDNLFRNQPRWAPSTNAADVFVGYAGELGLDEDTFESCLNSDEHAEVVTANLELGNQLGVGGTPTILIEHNGTVRQVGYDFASIQEYIDGLLAASNGA